MQVNLFKKKGTYLKDGEKKFFIRFYLRCNDSLIPIEPTYFNKKDEQGNDMRDMQYSGRKSVLEAFADELPEKDTVDNKEMTTYKKSTSPSNKTIDVSEADISF